MIWYSTKNMLSLTLRGQAANMNNGNQFNQKILEVYSLNWYQDTRFNIIIQEKIMDSSRTRKNYYEVLGLKPNATDAEIDNAYKKLSAQWHPDKNTANRREAETKFHEVSEAYDVLSNKNRRSHYDDFSHRQYSDQDADKTFERFYQEHGMEDQNEKKFFDQYYPDRKRSYYEVLGVPRGATLDEIKKAYRTLSLKYHPKSNADSADARKKFNEVNEAYNALSNQAKRNNYDIVSFGEIAPVRAHNIFENFWGDRFHELQDDFFTPVLKNKWSRNLDKALNNDWNNEDWGQVQEGQAVKTSTYYTNKNGKESKKSVSSKTKYVGGVPHTETTEEYEFPDGNREVRKIKDDGKGNVTSKVYNLKKGENLPIEN